MREAIFALVGVVVGGLLTGFVQYFFLVRQEARGVRAGARLLREDFQRNISYGLALNEKHAWFAPPSASAEIWPDLRSLLASVLTAADWDEIAQAQRGVDALRARFERYKAAGVPDRLLDDDDVLEIGTSVRAMIAASKTLEHLAGPFPMFRHLLRRMFVR